MPGKAVGRAAAELPWLCPDTDSLIGLAEDPAGAARVTGSDPAWLVFLVRFAGGTPGSSGLPQLDSILSPYLPETAAALLTAAPGAWVDPACPGVAVARRVADLAGWLARRIAEHTLLATPDEAEAAARLAPLGWYAVAAVGPADAAACLRDPEFATNPSRCQKAWWGLDQDAIARRLTGRWRLPGWLSQVVGNLNLPFAASGTGGANKDLFAVVSAAVREAQRQCADLGLTRVADEKKILAHLEFQNGVAAVVGNGERPHPSGPARPSGLDPNPHRVPLVRNLLRMAAEVRRRNGESLVVRLEERADELHRGLVELGDTTGEQLRDAKVAALAEFAAGAGHEINNPLAVISGNAQRLLRTEQDDERADTLRSVVRQTQRIAGILRDLMHFARPPRPEKSRFTAATLLGWVVGDLLPLAAESGVALELGEPATDLWVHADPKQLRHVVAAVVRNGIEAAGPGGWVRVGGAKDGDELRVAVEDSGPGLSLEVVEHAFDPFFCGRSAGRGRGLGLSTAWRLVGQNGGSVRFEPVAGGPTRFVICLPLTSARGASRSRKSA